jgi:hypothetical protein
VEDGVKVKKVYMLIKNIVVTKILIHKILNYDQINRRLKSKTPGNSINRVSHYEVVSEEQGIPNFKLYYCSRIDNYASSTEESQDYKRFDWIVSLDENGKK